MKKAKSTVIRADARSLEVSLTPPVIPEDTEVKTPADFLDELRNHHRLRFDSDVGKLMGWKPQQVSRYRRNLNIFSGETCQKIEESLSYPKGYVRLHMNAFQMPEPDVASSLAVLAWKLSRAAAAAVVIGVGVGGMVASLMPPDALPLLDDVRSVCVLC